MRAGSAKTRAARSRRALLPGALPELVEHLEIFLGIVVAPVMRGQRRVAPAPVGAVEIAGHDVPADAAARQVVERRDPAGEGVGRLVVHVDGDAEAEILGHCRHRRDQHHRVVHRQLHRLARGHVDAAAVDVVDPDDVGDEDAVEEPALQELRLLGPVAERVVVGRAVAGVGPEAVVDMADAVHGEGVQQDLLRGRRHQRAPCRGGMRPVRCHAPIQWYFHRTGSCRVWTRTSRQ